MEFSTLHFSAMPSPFFGGRCSGFWHGPQKLDKKKYKKTEIALGFSLEFNAIQSFTFSVREE